MCSSRLRSALLGSTLAIAAFTASAHAAQMSADLKRTLAATGMHASASNSRAPSLAHNAHVPGWSYTVLHDFAGAPNDGDGSGAEVTLDGAGNIFGTTDWGGPYGTGNHFGTLFEVTPNGTESILHSFGASGDGTNPDGAVTIESNGNMIGTTTFGGASNNGTIWRLTADGTYSILYSFSAGQGNFIRGRLVRDGKGNFYGTALDGGSDSYGTVFKYDQAKNKVSVLHSFNGNDGEFPEHGVVRDRAGNLYGVTAFGGTDDEGTVYRIAKDGTFSTLYNFTGGSDGGFLYGGLAIDKDGNLYGSADSGGTPGSGTVFELAPNGTLTVLYNFTGGADGAYPEGDMLLIGKTLYSTATGGGDASCQCGVIYKVTAKDREKVLEAFTPTSGNEYSAGLTAVGGVFYGTTQNGATGDNGVVFSLTKK